MKGILYNPKRPVTKDTVYQLVYEMHRLGTLRYDLYKSALPIEKFRLFLTYKEGELNAYEFVMKTLNEMQLPFIRSWFLAFLDGWIEHYNRQWRENKDKHELLAIFDVGCENALAHIRDFVNTGLDNCFPAYGGDVCTKR